MALQDLTPQLRTRLRRVERIVGLFVGVATLLLLAGFAYYLYHTAVRKGWFTPKCPYFTYVASAEGLKVGDPIVLMDLGVGEITMITAQPPGQYYKVFVAFTVKSPYYGYIWSDSKVKIAPAGFLGQRNWNHHGLRRPADRLRETRPCFRDSRWRQTCTVGGRPERRVPLAR